MRRFASRVKARRERLEARSLMLRERVVLKLERKKDVTKQRKEISAIEYALEEIRRLDDIETYLLYAVGASSDRDIVRFVQSVMAQRKRPSERELTETYDLQGRVSKTTALLRG